MHCCCPLAFDMPSPFGCCCCHSEKSERPFLFPHSTHVQLPISLALHSRHTPLVRLCHKVLAHSPGSKSEDVFAEPHPLHTLRSFRAHSMQIRRVLLPTLFFVKSDSCFHLPQGPKHSNGTPAARFVATHSRQKCLPSFRFHWLGANSCLNTVLSQPVHLFDGVCLSSTAFQSTCSPRSAANISSGPSGGPFVNDPSGKSR